MRFSFTCGCHLDFSSPSQCQAVAQALHEFNVKLRKDTRVDPLVLPLRDGLTVATLVS